MKNFVRIVLFSVIICFATTVVAQAPQKMSYQSVIRNSAGNLVANANVGMKISILKDNINGTAVYVETHAATTNQNGLVSLQIGGGNVISGSFAGIDWGNGSYFVKTETDPDGGTNYTVAGTSQLLSVPYALYAENSKPQGKSSIYITGYISDADVAAQLAREIGPYTENVYIINTHVLTTVDLSGIDKLINLQITDNADLTTVNAGSLSTIFKGFQISANSQLSTLNLNSFARAYNIGTGTTATISNNGLVNLSLAAFTAGYLSITANNSLLQIDLPGVLDIGAGTTITSNTALQTINFPAASGVLTTITGNTNLQTINFPTASAVIATIMGNANLTAINMPVVTALNTTLTDSKLISLALPSVTSGSLTIQHNDLLTSVDLPSLITGELNIYQNSALTALSIPVLSNVSSTEVRLRENKFPSSQVNAILNRFVTVTPVSGKAIYLYQIPAAPPTGQGLVDKATIISAGNTVQTN